MKIVIFHRLHCFPDKYTNSEINTCLANMSKQTPSRKDGGGRKEAIPSIFAQEKNREHTEENGERNYEESSRSETMIR